MQWGLRARAATEGARSGAEQRPARPAALSHGTGRRVLCLHFEEELSLPEVAAILDIPLGTVKSRLGYGLRAIRKHLKSIGGFDD